MFVVITSVLTILNVGVWSLLILLFILGKLEKELW